MSDATKTPETRTADMEFTEEERFIVPSVTVKELLSAIPNKCFERSALHSSLYVVQDFLFIAAFVAFAVRIPTLVSLAGLGYPGSKALSFALWNVYWFWAGLAGTGLWVCAHECGHQGFSESRTLNNAVGWVLHSALGVPYHSWRISHGRHHAATGHVHRDEVFVPRTREQLGYPALDKEREDEAGFNVTAERQAELREAIGDAPLYVLGKLLGQQLVGWPAYLIRNASGQKHYPKTGTNHFNPSAVMFDKRHRNQIIASDVGIVLLLAALGTWAFYRGFAEVATFYLVPYLWVNHWLVAITFLQHTDPLVPHYSDRVWTFPIGALTTIDRNCLGWVGPVMLHGICETHVAHHVSSKIPHYNAWKATAALKEFLGPHYQYRDGNFLVDLYKNYRDCAFVDKNTDAMFFKDRGGVARKVGVFPNKGGAVSDSGVDCVDTFVAAKAK